MSYTGDPPFWSQPYSTGTPMHWCPMCYQHYLGGHACSQSYAASSWYTLQACPVCEGRGNVPTGFYTRATGATSTNPDQCRTCDGKGILKVGIGGNPEKVVGPMRNAWDTYQRSLERLTLIGATAGEKERAAFAAGWKAREQAPNTLILDTSNAQMVPVLTSSAAILAGTITVNGVEVLRLEPGATLRGPDA